MKIKKKLNIKSSFNVKVSRFLATFQCQLSVKTKRRNSDPNTEPTNVRDKKINLYLCSGIEKLDQREITGASQSSEAKRRERKNRVKKVPITGMM